MQVSTAASLRAFTEAGVEQSWQAAARNCALARLIDSGRHGAGGAASNIRASHGDECRVCRFRCDSGCGRFHISRRPAYAILTAEFKAKKRLKQHDQ